MWPPTGELKPTEICSLVALEARSTSWAVLPTKSLRENPSLPLPDSGGSGCSLACGRITPISASSSHAFSSSLASSSVSSEDSSHWIYNSPSVSWGVFSEDRRQRPAGLAWSLQDLGDKATICNKSVMSGTWQSVCHMGGIVSWCKSGGQSSWLSQALGETCCPDGVSGTRLPVLGSLGLSSLSN